MKRVDEDKKEVMAVAANTFVAVANVVVEKQHLLTEKEKEEAAKLLLAAEKVLEQPTSPKIDELEKQAEAIESNSGIMVKIKQWVASFIKFLKDPFNRNHKEDLTQTTATTITAIEANERELVQPATNLLDNVYYLKKLPLL